MSEGVPADAGGMPPGGSLRIDKLLWFLRLARTRSAAQGLVATGQLRMDGRRVERAHAPVRAGSVLTLPLPAGVRVVRILTLPVRRGPAAEAQSCYLVLGERHIESDSQSPAPA